VDNSQKTLNIESSDNNESHHHQSSSPRFDVSNPLARSPPNYKNQSSFLLNSNDLNSKNSSNMNNPLDEPLIVHPGAISAILHLSVCVTTDKQNQVIFFFRVQMRIYFYKFSYS
jgi:hypothetical protein